jgi:hypothetical protein
MLPNAVDVDASPTFNPHVNVQIDIMKNMRDEKGSFYSGLE